MGFVFGELRFFSLPLRIGIDFNSAYPMLPVSLAMTVSTSDPSFTPSNANAAQSSEHLESPIVFFDGECIMCNTFLDLMIRIDHPMTLKVAALQGTTSERYLPPLAPDPEDWSIYLLDETGLYNQSDAVIRIAQCLGGVWSMAAAAGLFPKGMRDGVYRAIAANRYRMFGKRECRIPDPLNQARFLP